MRLSIGISAYLWLLVAAAAAGQESPTASNPTSNTLANAAAVDFARDVLPTLRKHCFECHGTQRQDGQLRLDSRSDLARSGVVVPGQPLESELIRRIELPASDAERMPAHGQPLNNAERQALGAWIESGAVWPEDVEPARHWAYVAPQPPSLPTVSAQHWPQSPIDYFVLAQLETLGLTPSPAASPDKLMRRIYLDLIGVPPSTDEIENFLNDTSPERWEALVDRLLSRPEFGQRWARPWLDAARYADSHGFQRDNLRDLWAYRDWVIESFNADMPFDQFTIEQLAGDLLPAATTSQRIATGFHRTAPVNVEAGSLPEETRIEQVIDRLNTTAAVWLGTTLECCQCHDHKYDPFTQREYYQLLAFFNSTEVEAERKDPNTPSSIDFKSVSIPLPNAERDQQRRRLQKEAAALRRQLADRRAELMQSLPQWAQQQRQRLTSVGQYHSLAITEFQSQGTTDAVRLLDDGAVLLVGNDPPDKDVYTFKVAADIAGVRGFRLDVLRHDSLPGGGPGRGDAVRRNFVLNTFSAHSGDETRLKFSQASASFSQKNQPVAGAIDESAQTGWAVSPEFGRDHWAIFMLERPVDMTREQAFTIKLVQQFGSARSFGCFRISAMTGDVDQDALPEEVARLIALEADQWSAADTKMLVDHCSSTDRLWQQIDKQSKAITQRLETLAPDTTEVMVELDQPRMMTIFQRGDYRQPGEAVVPDTPAILHAAQFTADQPRNRLDLARWLVDRDNPLVARVTVNRWWQELFGQGLVHTPEDFGIKGDLPTHPELLDWLACYYMDQGWSLKRLLKMLVLSSTYQQGSSWTERLREMDPNNHWLARGPAFRMDAEMIRDNALAISGLLNTQHGGPAVRPYQPEGVWKKVGGTAYDYEVSEGHAAYRRGIYVVLKRGTPYPSFINFDASSRATCTLQRSRTNTPLQALTLMNDPVYIEAAMALADRVLRQWPNATTEKRIATMFQLCTGRLPNEGEAAALGRLLADEMTKARNRAGQMSRARKSSEIVDHQEIVERHALESLAVVMLNLHETICKD